MGSTSHGGTRPRCPPTGRPSSPAECRLAQLPLRNISHLNTVMDGEVSTKDSAMIVGADPDELDRLATALSAEASGLRQLGRRLSQHLHAAPWRGPGADRFRTQWDTMHFRQVENASVFLLDLARQLNLHAAQQRDASRADHSQGQGLLSTSMKRSDAELIGFLTSSTDPYEVLRRWNGLSAEERMALIGAHPAELGNLDGIPPQVRFEINRQRIREYLSSGSGNPEFRATLAPLSGDRGAGGYGSSQVLFFDPSGDGRVAVVRGNLATASHVAVVVPGMGNGLHNFGNVLSDADTLRAAAGPQTAVVAWLGYDTPKGFPDLRMIEATSEAQAITGAPALVSLMEGLRAATTADLTVIGHSYGSALVGNAAKTGLEADRVILIGSPGPGAESVRQFNLPAGAQVFAGAAEGDLVSHARHFGNDPTDPSFGSVVFETGGDNGMMRDEHSHYYDPNSVSVTNMGRIVRGDPIIRDVPSLLEQGASAARILDRSVNQGIDSAQERVNLPFIDDPLDSYIDAEQARGGLASRINVLVADGVDDLLKKISSTKR